MPFYVISLIEHKSSVDYNITMQMLRYMVGIWREYETEMQTNGRSGGRTFRYPPILSIVYYEGMAKWTADMHFRNRIYMNDVCLCRKMNVPEEETCQLVEQVKERNMGYLFENMEKIDIQEERRIAAEERQKADEERQKRIEIEQKQKCISIIINSNNAHPKCPIETFEVCANLYIAL